MIRYGSVILIAAGSCAAAFTVAACGDDSVGGPPMMTGTGGASAGGSMGTGNTGTGNTPGTGNTSNAGGSSGGGSVVNADSCSGACCPSDPSCYSSSAGKSAPGSACMARIENTPTHIQLRQTWIDILTPKGNTIPIVLSTLNTFTQFTESACNTPKGGTGYMQAVDLDLTAGVSTLGYTKFVAPSDTAAAISDGLCFVDVGMGVDSAGKGYTDIADYNNEKNFDFSLPPNQMSPTTGWPEGLPAPMPQPWKIAPTKAKKLDADFDLSKDREAILKRLEPTGDLGMAGFTGVFYYDTATGTSHGYSPVSFQIIYDAPAKVGDPPTSYIAVPIREAEIKYRTNDPMHPNCVGKYLPDNLDMSTGCGDTGLTEGTKPGWGGLYDTTPGEGDAAVNGYFLITELEQVYSKVLGMTLCVSYPTLDVSVAAGWANMDTNEKRCRKAAKWDPSKPDGIPTGDWCAKDNKPAHDDCHDAYLSKSFHAFQAFKVKTDHCTAF